MNIVADNRFDATKARIKEQYMADQRPWVIAYSGGKDSTLLLQLVYEVLISLKDAGYRLKPVHVMSSDTRVEAPNVEAYLHKTLKILEGHALASGLPLEVHRVSPKMEDTFWSLLIGRGYPSPTRFFRWCTQRMKIDPSKACINAITAVSGSVILLLGTRYDESSTRKQTMQSKANNSRGLHPHNDIANTLIYSPIADWSTDDVWEYLFSHNPPPWGGSHDFMLNLYKQANGGECPIVLDLNTPSCGGSRFGCWTCTVVSQDKSMQGFIETGEAWMRPLNEFRNWLQQLRDQPGARRNERRNGLPGKGPFVPEIQMEILRRLLALEQNIGRQLISDEELAIIQHEWNEDFDPLHAANDIAAEFGRRPASISFYGGNMDEQALLRSIADDHEINLQVIEELFRLVTEKYPSMDKRGSKQGLEDDVRRVIEKWIPSSDDEPEGIS